MEPRQLLSLTHLYTFNDGTANDSIGSANASLFNCARISNGRLQLQNAGLTSGSSTVQYAQLPNGILPPSGSATIEAWYMTDSGTPNWMRVFDFGNGSSQSYFFYTPKSSNSDARTVIRPAGGSERFTATATGTLANQGLTNMVAVVVDAAAGTLSLYLNGAFVSSASLSGIDIGAVNESLAYLGRSQFGADPGFSGAIDELRIYDAALDSAAIAADSAAGPALWTTPSNLLQPRQVELLNRGLIALQKSSSQVYLSWRMLGTDPSNVAFNIYRSSNGGAAIKLNGSPLTATTDYTDNTSSLSATRQYFVKPVIGGVEQSAGETYTLPANAPVQQYIPIDLDIPPGDTSPDGVAYTYSANDASVGDLDGDGQYEVILKWDPSNAHDNSQSGYTGNVYIDAYKLDGTRLWRIDLGRNIRAGAHYTQFIVYDLDGDGKAEVAMRTAPGTIDGQGHYVLMGSDNPNADYRNSSGYILTGPEYLTVFNGQTGAAMATTAYLPDRGTASQWGDSYGNRVDRFLAATAYLDGKRPSLIMARGYYGPQSSSGQARSEITAWDFRNGQLSLRWWFKAGYNINNDINRNYIGQGAHSINIADVDGDGKDEIIYGAMAVDDDGTPLYSTGLGHGDALHTSDMDPSRPGLETFMVHESAPAAYGGELRDARTGQPLLGIDGGGTDVGRGVALNIEPHAGFEMWTSSNADIYNVDGTVVAPKPSNMFTNFGIYWDADLYSELLDGTTISDWNYSTHNRVNLVYAPAGLASNNGTKATPCLVGDILGDWREEVIWRTGDNTQLQIWSTWIPASSRMDTLMHDVQYREAIAWQNVAYNQPPHPSFYIGPDMAAPPQPRIYTVPPIPGDANLDGSVTFDDFLVLANNINLPGSWQQGDFNGDGKVTFDDFLILTNNFGQSIFSAGGTSAASAAATVATTVNTAAASPAIFTDDAPSAHRHRGVRTDRRGVAVGASDALPGRAAWRIEGLRLQFAPWREL